MLPLPHSSSAELPLPASSSPPPASVSSTYKSAGYYTYPLTTEMNYSMIDQLLETEKQRNKMETWNKLDKTQKTCILHAFAEKYGKDHGFPMKEIRGLKSFFSECLDKAKLQKTKEVVYNKESREITSIPGLHFNTTTRAFTLKMVDPKRVSTLKSLTPKRAKEIGEEKG